MTRTEDRSYWNATAGEGPAFPALAGDLEVDVAIVGGGIVGVTAARLLKDRGQRVALVEARRVGRQVTGKSTAKISSQHGILYQTLERKFGQDKARLYAEAQEAGIREIARLARQYGVDADIEPTPAFVYTNDESYVEQIEKEVEVARRLGLPASLTRDTGLPFEVLQAMRWENQAQFHPTRYVAGLAATLPGEGCHVFERSRVVDYDPNRVVTDAGSVRAGAVVMATHLPLGQVGLYYSLAYPMAEPVIAAPIRRVPPGMYKNAEQPGHSIRTHRRGDQVYAIVAGSHYKPGHPDDELRYMADIERWLAAHFDAGPVEYRWINEDYSAMDSAPFIGWSSHGGNGYLVATGFAAWGISNGTAAAMIIADLATGKENGWSAIFDAARIKPVAGAGEFVKENAEVAAHLVSGYLSRKPKSYDELAPGDAAIMKIDGDNVAAFKDEDGRVHAVSAVCTHMGCLVGWNATDRTWDCPCHGSRFELSGEVIHGPATKPLGSRITG
ncbi:MAG: FAD-dependent oxidoreductase [Alphaproteobacteria bacterium]|nr:FAD-dependent oxidoreductase [Alphaproteobacteria bacterium]MBV9370437.1 FAD-dependent oxidoreductase [Alphaproteobacteria bacterium]MBV9900823.1 FAD-dependent oxidoreductase [Alphaproteobacteria bacterium]